jgi:hypothetical protein
MGKYIYIYGRVPIILDRKLSGFDEGGLSISHDKLSALHPRLEEFSASRDNILRGRLGLGLLGLSVPSYQTVRCRIAPWAFSSDLPVLQES